MEKMPENRYQSARGLRLDLEWARAEWRATGRVEPFPLGELDVSDRLKLPQRLYGVGRLLLGDEELVRLPQGPVRSLRRHRLYQSGSPQPSPPAPSSSLTATVGWGEPPPENR